MSSCYDRLRACTQHVRGIGSHGHYSVERMLSLREYSLRMPLRYVLLVYALSVVPAIATIVLLDAIPLNDPHAGSNKNVAAWGRIALGSLAVAFGAMLEQRRLVPAAELSIRQCAVVAVAATISFTASMVLVAKLWVFPIPFMIVIGNVPWAFALYGGTFAVIGKHKLATTPAIKEQFKRFKSFLDIASMFVIVYSGYGAVFRLLDSGQQLAFLLVLPVIKYILKKVVIAALADVEDVVFAFAVSVDLFNALFQSKCMQNSGSYWTTVGVVAFDATQNMYTLWRLFHSAGDFHQVTQHSCSTHDLLTFCVDAMLQSELLDLTDVRVKSWSPMVLTRASQDQLDSMCLEQVHQQQQQLATGCPNSGKTSSRAILSQAFTRTVSTSGVLSNAVVPWPVAPKLILTDAAVPLQTTSSLSSLSSKPSRAASSAKLNTSDTTIPRAQRTLVVKKTLALLWRCERVLLVEYVETAIPLVYGMSLAILYSLPNAKYYPDVRDMTTARLEATITSILVYAALEFVSLVYLHCILSWRYKLSAMHQLAFVLSTEWHVIQGTFVSWTIIVLSFTLVHYGNDFTFEFEWLK